MNKNRNFKRTERIDNELLLHKAFVMRLIDEYNGAVAERERMKNTGHFSESYIQETFNKRIAELDIKGRLEKSKAETLTRVKSLLGYCKADMDAFFTGDVTRGFAEKINAYNSVGVDLSDREFDLLHKQAKTYSDLRLIQTFAEKRNEKIRTTEVDKDGNINAVDKVSGNGFVSRTVKVPDIERAYAMHEEYERAVLSFVSHYYGNENELLNVSGSNIASFVGALSTNYYDHKAKDKYNKYIEELSAFLPENKVKTELTDNDKRLIDALVDEKHPFLAKSEVKRWIDINPDYADLFALDDRYAQFVEE